MATALDLPLPPSADTPFVVAFITEPPGALAILSRTTAPDGHTWNRVVRLTSPRRGKRFSRNTETGRVLRALHADGLLGRVMINLPEHAGIPRDGAAFREPDIQHLVRGLERMGVQAMVTATPLWRPAFDVPNPDGTRTLASTMAAYLPDGLRGTPHGEAQCIDALLLAIFADAPDDDTPPYRPH
ncbi:hypothetical protein [Methylobacterium segetis]|uniref:hypothetical protein n=1 Tax=Methylobacterium segetis TaxID=2488750 RepID=UPI00104B986D|nr:hypothetical protein [Methylobacterium segetis]